MIVEIGFGGSGRGVWATVGSIVAVDVEVTVSSGVLIEVGEKEKLAVGSR